MAFSTTAAIAVTLVGCERDESTPAVGWCGADSTRVPVALAAADDPGLWAREGLSELRFVELWRAGGLNEGEELAFPLNLSVSREGRLAIADWELGNLSVVEPDGTWIRDWAPRGQGPGELARPAAARWIGGSDTVAVFDIDNGRVVFLASGEAVRPPIRVDAGFLLPIAVSGQVRWVGVTPSGGVLIAPVPVPESSSSDSRYETALSSILLQGPGARSIDTLAVAVLPTVPERPPFGRTTAPGWPQPAAAVGEDGSIVVGGMDARYRTLQLDASGDTALVICRDAPALPFSERERRADADDESLEILEQMMAEAQRPDSLAPFGRMFLSSEGRLWVQRDRPSSLRFREAYHGVPGALYDVFDADGRYLGEVRAPENARLQAALGDTVWAYEIGELDETWVVAYGLRWDED
jgi:hypothetical protein